MFLGINGAERQYYSTCLCVISPRYDPQFIVVIFIFSIEIAIKILLDARA
jgi:hypothetical protein